MYNVVCIIQGPVPSTEISIIRPFSYLSDQHKLQWQIIREDRFTPEVLTGVDLVIFHRNCRPNSTYILNIVKKAGAPIIYELDDNFFEIPEDLPVGRYLRLPQVVKTIENFLSSADLVKIGSPEMSEYVTSYNRNVIYLPYAVDLSILNGMKSPISSRVTIGYAASIHHQRDFTPILKAIYRIGKNYPQVHWDFIGCLPEGLEGLPNSSFLSFIPNYVTFIRELFSRGWHMGLAPLIDAPHNRCKTDNKLREYGACMIPGIYSNIPPYSTNVKNNVTGLLADNTEEDWYNSMERYLRDEPFRRAIAKQARKWVEQYRSIPVIAQQWLKLFEQTLKMKGKGQ